jgi:DnaJ-class molecular chaperone
MPTPTLPKSPIESPDEPETKTLCPICKGSGGSIEFLDPGRYMRRDCKFCRGQGMVSASQAAELRGIRNRFTP